MINTQLQLSNTNTLSFSTGHYKTKSKLWLISYNNNNIILGKAKRYNHHDDSISITHWQIEFDYSHTNLYSPPAYTCKLCTGCSLNSNRIRNICTINVLASLSNKLLYRRTNNNTSNKLNLHANLLDSIYSIALRNPTTIPRPPTIVIYNNAIFEIFRNNQSSQILQQIAISNTTHTQLTFYTDKSVSNITTKQCTMGIG